LRSATSSVESFFGPDGVVELAGLVFIRRTITEIARNPKLELVPRSARLEDEPPQGERSRDQSSEVKS
jgi:hypothetical protein